MTRALITGISGFVGTHLSGHLIAAGWDVVGHHLAPPSLKWISPAWLWSVYRCAKQKMRFSETEGIEPEFVKDAVSREEINDRIERWSRLLAVPG